MKLQTRLIVYVTFCVLLVPTVWLLVPSTRSEEVQPRMVIKRSEESMAPSQVSEDISRPLEALFKATDTTSDGVLSANELTWAIHRAVEKHMQSAMRNNIKHFFGLDKINHNGQVEWGEWLKKFYQDNNMEEGQDLETRRIREKLSAAKAAWSEAARSNPDALNIDEFLSFTHPETSHSVLAQQAEDMFGRYDSDANGVITLSEFLQDPLLDFEEEDDRFSRSRIFKEDMDTDGNGSLDRREVVTYLDPKQVSQAKVEARRLIELADRNDDGFLDWNELLGSAEEFFDSQWMSPQRAFHGDL